MRSVSCEAFGPVEDLTIVERDDWRARRRGVVVKVAAAGVNYVDALFVQGKYQIKPALPFVPGGEIAGTITEIGDEVEGWAVGDRVMGLIGLGGYAEQAAVAPQSLVKVPDNMTFTAAATFIQNYSTAWFAMTRRTQLNPAETVLVLGAGGGVGLAAIDVATSLGTQVIAAASSHRKRDAAFEVGADAVIDYTKEDLKSAVREFNGVGADVVVDPVGGPHAEPALRSLREFGRYLVIGFAGGPIPSIPLNQVLLRNRTVIGVDWGAWMLSDPEGQQDLLAGLLEMVADGRLRPPEPETRPLDGAAEALTDLLERRVTGKLVLVP